MSRRSRNTFRESGSSGGGGDSAGFVPAFDLLLSQEEDQVPVDGKLTLGGVEFDVENSAKDGNAGPVVVDGKLRFLPGSTNNLNMNTRTAPIVGCPLSSLVPGLEKGDLIRLWVESTVQTSANYQWLTAGVETASKIGLGSNDLALTCFKGFSGSSGQSNMKWYGSAERNGTLSPAGSFQVMEWQVGGGMLCYSAPSYGGELTLLAGNQPMAHVQRPDSTSWWSDSARLVLGAVATSISGAPVFDVTRIVVEQLARS